KHYLQLALFAVRVSVAVDLLNRPSLRGLVIVSEQEAVDPLYKSWVDWTNGVVVSEVYCVKSNFHSMPICAFVRLSSLFQSRYTARLWRLVIIVMLLSK